MFELKSRIYPFVQGTITLFFYNRSHTIFHWILFSANSRITITRILKTKYQQNNIQKILIFDQQICRIQKQEKPNSIMNLSKKKNSSYALKFEFLILQLIVWKSVVQKSLLETNAFLTLRYACLFVANKNVQLKKRPNPDFRMTFEFS